MNQPHKNPLLTIATHKPNLALISPSINMDPFCVHAYTKTLFAVSVFLVYFVYTWDAPLVDKLSLKIQH